jgi:hypothetical protein
MTKQHLFSVMVCGLLAVTAGAQTQLLDNPSFESGPTPIVMPDEAQLPPEGMGSIPESWTLARVNNHDPSGWKFGQGLFYIDGARGDASVTAHSGERFLTSSKRWWYDGGSAEQTVSVSPGIYDLALSFYAVVYDRTPTLSHVSGEIIVDGEVVAAGQLASTGEEIADYRKVTAAWKGSVNAQITVRLTATANGLAGEGLASYAFVAIDDVELWSRACGTQHEVLDISPNVIDLGQPSATITLTGANLANVNSVRLWRSGLGESTSELAGSNLVTAASSLSVDLTTDSAGAGFYDVIVEQPGCNPRVITGGLQIRDPSAPLNLLENPSFEVLIHESQHWNDVGNGQIWFGDYAKDPALNPIPVDGAHGIWSYWSNSGSSGENESTRTWQTVPVASGSSVHFVGYLDCNVQEGSASTSTATVTLYDGLGQPGDAQIGTETVTQANAGELGTWTEVDIVGTANSGFVTVEFTTQISGSNGVAAVFADAFSLTASPGCSEQLYARYAYPSSGDHFSTTRVTITGGSNLDTVPASGVMLVFVDNARLGDETEIIVPGTIVNQSPTSLLVDFPVGTMGAPAGLYNLVLEKPGCPSPNLVDLGWMPTEPGDLPPAQTEVPPTFVDKFEVICANPVLVTSVEPGSLSVPAAEAVLTLHGQNLNLIDSVSLVLDVYSHPGNINQVAPDGSWMIAKWYNLDGDYWLYGPYDLVATRADDQCGDPEPLIDAVRIVPGGNMLLNGSFEDDAAQVPPENPADWPDYWLRTQLERGGIEWINPGWYAGAGPRTGVKCVGAASNWLTNRGYVEQSIGLPKGPGEYDLTLSFWAQFYDQGGTPSRAIGEIIVDGSIVASATLDNAGIVNQLTPYTQASVDWKGVVQTNITIRVTAEGQGNPAFGVAVIDDVELIIPPARCHTPFADADGDGDVDQSDFGVFQACYTGPGQGVPVEPAYCICLDRPAVATGEPDGDVDQVDLTAFEACASGPFLAANPACEQ